MNVNVEFHFDFGSPNAYLAHLVIPAIEKRIVKATALTGGKVVCVQSADGIELRATAECLQDPDTVIQLQLDGPASELAPR